MVSVAGSVEINRPTNQVFEFLANPENGPKWQSGLTESKLLTEGPVRVGSQFKETVKFLGRPIELICEYVEVEPGRKMVFKSDNSKTLQFDLTFLVEPGQAGASRVTVSGHSHVSGLLRLLEPLFAGEVKSASRKELQQLKAALEGAG